MNIFEIVNIFFLTNCESNVRNTGEEKILKIYLIERARRIRASLFKLCILICSIWNSIYRKTLKSYRKKY